MPLEGSQKKACGCVSTSTGSLMLFIYVSSVYSYTNFLYK